MNNPPPSQVQLNQAVQTVRELRLRLPPPGIVIEMVPALVGDILPAGTTGTVVMVGPQVTVQFAIQGDTAADLRGNLLRSPSTRLKLKIKASDFWSVFRIVITRMR